MFTYVVGAMLFVVGVAIFWALGKAADDDDTPRKTNVVHVTDVSQLDSVIAKAGGLVVIDYSAKWCGPCKAIAPKYDLFSLTYENVTFLHVDIDELSSANQVKKIRSVPTFEFYKSGAKLDVLAGANASKLEHMIKKNK
mmetsp:Transcript_25420/g.28278  ORF Transcript_25420/g.28278 Transcript_25420/m.28278 type:complete len:139 (-) Transcript_25420:70-486(-)